MATCNECHKQVRGVLRAHMGDTPGAIGDVTSGGGLVVADVVLQLLCPHDGTVLARRLMEVEELFEHSCKTGSYRLMGDHLRPTDQTIPRPDKRSSRRWLGADVTVSLECPRCRELIKVAVTVGDYALEFLTAA